MKTLEEIDEILYGAYQDDLFAEITLMPGLDVRKNWLDKTVVVTYPKLELGMPQCGLRGRIVEEGEESYCFDLLEKDELVEFETEKGYSFLLKHSEIADCLVLPFLLYPELYNS